MAAPSASKPTSKDAGGDGAGGLMTAAELRALLHVAKQGPVNCAVALSRDKAALVVLHKKTRPRKLVAELKAQAKAKGAALETTSVRFGHVAVDGASDGGKATFTVNKEAPNALRLALLAQVRPAGMQRCEVVVDAELEDEPEEGAGHGEAAGHGAAPSGQASAAGAQGGAALPRADGGSARAEVPAAPAEAPADSPAAPADSPAAADGPGATAGASPGGAAALEGRLVAAVRRMAASPHPEPGAEQARQQVARLARDALRAGDLARAERAIGKLEEVLGEGSPGPGAKAAPQGAGAPEDEGGPAAAASPGGGAPEAPGAGDAPAGRPDRAAALKEDLRGLVQRVAGAGPADRTKLVGVGNAATDALAAGDPAEAEAGTGALRRVLPAGNRAGVGGAGTGGLPPATGPDQPGPAAAALRAGFDERAAAPRDRSADVQVADGTPRGAATDAGGPGTGPAPAIAAPVNATPASPTSAPSPASPADDASWVSADGWDHRMPPGTPPVVMDVPRALGEFDDAHGRVLTRGAGLAQAAGGAGEGVAAGGLLLTPEPTMLTKVAGTAMGANALDNVQAGLRTAWTGQAHQTLAAQAAGAGAQALGASPERAARVADVADALQGVAGGGAMTVAGLVRDDAGMAARGAGALGRGVPPALTGEVLPLDQPVTLGGVQVRQAPAQPAWPQTTTVRLGRVGTDGPSVQSVQPREPPQLAPPPEPPPPTAEQQVQALPGHGHARHGTHTTLAEQEQRLRTGRAPDGKRSPTGQATRFDSHDAELDAVTRATTEMAARERAGLLPRDVIVAHPQGSRLRPTLPSVRLVVTGRPGGYGSGLRAGGSRSSVTLIPTGQLPSARVTFERDPLRGWIPVTQFPTAEPPTPLTPPPP